MRSSRQPAVRPRGFTLIELLIVMAIMGVLVALVASAIVKAREAANRTTCINNLRQFGIAFQAHQHQLGYFPTAGTADYCAPSYGGNGLPVSGWQQDAGWGFQILPFMDGEPIWMGGGGVTNIAKMTNALTPSRKFFFCPSRRPPVTLTYTNASFPSQVAYGGVKGGPFKVSLNDYAACNGNSATVANSGGIVLSQAAGRATVGLADIRDGASYTLLLGEKAGTARFSGTLMEDDMGYASAFSSTNFNTVRFTSSALLPLPDSQVTALNPAGGAFGSAHSGTWNALMADGSVTSLSYTIDPTVFSALGTIAGGEIIDDNALTP